MGQVVYGSCVEPGGMLLDDDECECECPACGGVAIRRDWESVEGGSINPYWSLHCTACKHRDGDRPESMDDDSYSWQEEDFDESYAAMLSYIDGHESETPILMQSSDYLALAQGVRHAA
ncbi:hypothetical protein P2W50_31465 [Pseudomonas protegens]|uniref:hypothetical protein n=1 Tax=Pseudomonas protegens TaxID=380021 RepID=UPI0023ED2343|nr:hypothetical protein [Pseudomonas protegens]MDF4211173.1 hypothetical protein [Pseudomonas protegens]